MSNFYTQVILTISNRFIEVYSNDVKNVLSDYEIHCSICVNLHSFDPYSVVIYLTTIMSEQVKGLCIPAMQKKVINVYG